MKLRMKSQSAAPSSTTWRARASPRAASVPGLICSQASALAAVDEKVGSTTTRRAPAATASWMKCTSGMRVSSGLAPIRRMKRLLAQSLDSCSAFCTPKVIGMPIGRSPLKSKLVPCVMPRAAQAR